MLAIALAWGIASALVAALLCRDYSRDQVRPITEAFLWVWHALNYVLLVLLAAENVWSLGLPAWLAVLGVVAVGAGIAVIAAGFYEFRSARRLTGGVRDKVIDSGVYRYSRHPQYLGTILTLFGGAVAGDSGAALLLAAVLSAAFLVYLPAEERYARQGLGEAYDRYRRRTPMIAGRPG